MIVVQLTVNSIYNHLKMYYYWKNTLYILQYVFSQLSQLNKVMQLHKIFLFVTYHNCFLFIWKWLFRDIVINYNHPFCCTQSRDFSRTNAKLKSKKKSNEMKSVFAVVKILLCPTNGIISDGKQRCFILLIRLQK